MALQEHEDNLVYLLETPCIIHDQYRTPLNYILVLMRIDLARVVCFDGGLSCIGTMWVDLACNWHGGLSCMGTMWAWPGM